MSNEIGVKLENTDGEPIETDSDPKAPIQSDTESKIQPNKPRSVSFNRDVHVKRFGKPRNSRAASTEPIIRKEPFTHLSKEEIIEEANKVRAQAESLTCTADHPPEKFFSLPHRKKLRDDRERRNSDDSGTPDGKSKSPLGRSTSDVSSKRRERTSLSTLFRRAQKNKPPIQPIVVTPKPNAAVKRSKSDVTDLKSNTNLNTPPKPIRKRSGSETEEFLKSLRNKKTQLSPIIESSPREDYFKKTPPLEVFQKQKLSQKDSNKSDELSLTSDSKKVNPIEKPPRYKAPEKSEPKPPARTKRGKSSEKEKESSPITETPKRKTEIKKTLLVDEIDSFKAKENIEAKEKIKDSIRKIEDNVYGSKDMIHSSQKPPDKPPLTRGQTVNHIVKILKEDQLSPPPKAHLISPSGHTNVNQPFSYTKPSLSPDPNLFIRNSPDRVPTPVNAMNDKGVVYAHVVRENGDTGSSNFGKQTVHKTYSPSREKYGNVSDEDEGLGYEEKHKYSNRLNYDHKINNGENLNSFEGLKIMDSPIRPRFREYKLTSFDDFEPTYANNFPSGKNKSYDYIDTFRGQGDGMDNKKVFESDLDFNELSHRRQLLESRLNARRERERNVGEPISRYLAETDPIYEAEKRMKATEKYVNETARYIHHTLERDRYTESTVTEDYNRYDPVNAKIKYNTDSRTFQKVPKGELDRREFIDSLEPRYKDDKAFPPEPEYEPPSLEFNTGKPILTPDEYKEKKYKVKKHFTSSHDITQSGQKYKGRDDWFGSRKGHYASNPEIAQEREDEYANLRYKAKQAEAYHNSLRRVRNKDKYKEDYGVRRHDSGDSRDYYRENSSPRRYEIDNRLVDSGIENDFRKDSSGEIHRKFRRHESDDDVRNTSMFLASERRHTEDNYYPSEQIYANGEYLTRFKDYRDDSYRKEYSRERNGDDYDPKDRYDKSPNDDKVSAKPPKAKKLSGLEKMKQLFSRDSSKKSKKEKEAVQQKARTRVLKSPEHLAQDDSEYKRYTDPEPSDIEVKKKYYESEDERRYKSSREDLDRHRSSREDLNHPKGPRESLDRHRPRTDSSRPLSPREEPKYRGSRDDVDRYRSSREDVRYRSSDPKDSDVERKYRDRDNERYDRTLKHDRRYTERKEEERRYNSSDRDSDLVRSSDAENDRRKTKSRTAGPLDSPALAARYRSRRRLATPSPTPSPPRRAPVTPAPTSSGNWFKSLDRLTGRKKKKDAAVEKESVLTTESDTRKAWSKSKTLNSPAKNLRFFGDTDLESDSNMKTTVTKTRSHPQTKTHSSLKKTTSNSSAGIDELDNQMKSYSLSNLQEKQDSPRSKYFKRNLQNINETHDNSEIDSSVGKRASKPPISPYDRSSRSQSSSKTLKGSKSDLRRRNEERGSSSELNSSKQELRNLKHRRRTPAPNSGESSTEGDSSHQSQRSVVYLHATTVGDIPDPGHLSRNRSRDDVSSVNSSNLQVRSTTKSFSIFAPWTPRHYPENQDVHYTTKPRKSKTRDVKNTPTRSVAESDRMSLQKNKSYSQSTLTKKPQSTINRLTSSSTSLYRKPERKENSSVQNATLSRKPVNRDKRSQSNEVLNKENRAISRSVSMPKDKKAGWFKLSNKKKMENSRVR